MLLCSVWSRRWVTSEFSRRRKLTGVYSGLSVEDLFYLLIGFISLWYFSWIPLIVLILFITRITYTCNHECLEHLFVLLIRNFISLDSFGFCTFYSHILLQYFIMNFSLFNTLHCEMHVMWIKQRYTTSLHDYVIILFIILYLCYLCYLYLNLIESTLDSYRPTCSSLECCRLLFVV